MNPVCVARELLFSLSAGIAIAFELVKDKEAMAQKEYAEEYGRGTSVVLRLTKPWWGTGRRILGDSAFASGTRALDHGSSV